MERDPSTPKRAPGAAVLLATLAVACSGSAFSSTEGRQGLGGAGSSDGGSGGTASRGGTASGGSGADGSATGGKGAQSSTGGTSTGGTSTGGTSTGGSATGGTSTGGASTGGTSTGGTGGGQGGTSTGGAGGTGGCTTAQQCPQPGAACAYATCVNGTCHVQFTSGCGAGGADGGAPASQCPEQIPADGALCDVDLSTGGQADCTWGDDPRPECRTTGSCLSEGKWQIKRPSLATCSEPALPPACPTSPPAGDCVGDELPCWYDDGTRCHCSSCVGGSGYPVCQLQDPPQWYCQTPPVGCPDTIPQAGTACDDEGLSCGPDCELVVICLDGRWSWRGGACPICASPDTPIATPDGDRAISELSVGDLVYSVAGGAIVAVPIARVGSTPVQGHSVVRVQLESGATLEISAGHPTADGRTFGDLRPGDALDTSHTISSVAVVPYRHDRTYDILPASDTGTYFAAGALVGSTLH